MSDSLLLPPLAIPANNPYQIEDNDSLFPLGYHGSTTTTSTPTIAGTTTAATGGPAASWPHPPLRTSRSTRKVLGGGSSIKNSNQDFTKKKKPSFRTTIDWSKFVVALENFSRHLAAGETVEACQVLDSGGVVTVTTSSPKSSTSRGSPSSFHSSSYWDNTNHGVRHQNSVPSLSPSSSAAADDGGLAMTSASMLDQGEWESLVLTPLILLAAAEELVMGFGYLEKNDETYNNNKDDETEHSIPLATASCTITGLYLRTQMELRKVKELLLLLTHSLSVLAVVATSSAAPSEDSALLVPDSNMTTADDDDDDVDHRDNDEHVTVAKILLEGSLESLAEIARVRCKLIDLQCLLFRQQQQRCIPPTTATATTIGMEAAVIAVAQLYQSFDTAMGRIRSECAGGEQVSSSLLLLPIDPIVAAVRHELALWQCLFETCSALERCS
jgi:hypothetical protein